MDQNSKYNANYPSGQNSQNSQNYQYSQNYQNSQNTQENYVAENAAPVEEAKPAKKEKSSKKGLWIGIIAFILVVAIGVGGFFGYKHFFSDGDDKPAANQPNARKIENEELAKLSYSDVTELEFYPTSTYTKKQIDAAAKVMEERVKILGKNYEIKTDDEKVTLIIEKSLLGDSAYERTQSVEMIMSNGVIGLGSNYSSYGEKGFKDGIESMKAKKMSKVDILSDFDTTLDEDRYNMIDAAEAKEFNILEVKLKADYVAEFEEEIEYIYPTTALCAYHNASDFDGEEKYMGSVLFPDDEDKSTLYIISPAAGFAKNNKLIQSLLTGKEIELSFALKITDEPSWETDTKKFGANQVDKLSGNTVIVECTPDDYTLKYVSDVDFAKHKEIIKNRFDIIGADYMLGLKGFDNKTICVKVDPKKISLDFIRFIFGHRDYSVRSAFDTIYSFGSMAMVEEDGLAIQMETYDSLADLKSEYNISGDTVYLVVNDVTVAKANINDLNESDGTLLFKDFTCFNDAEATAKDKTYVKLIASVYDEDYVSFTPGSYEIRYYEGNSEKKNVNINDISWKYSSLNETDESIVEIVEGMGHSVTKHINERNMLVITLDVAIDEDLVVNFYEEAEAVYNACGFDTGAYNKINFVVKDEKKESPADSFRIEFNKDTYDGKMEYYFKASGPTFYDYWSDAYDYRENDEFYAARYYV